MGMFDYLEIDVKRLPIDEAAKEKLKDADFQTKDFDCLCNRIFITDDGELGIWVFTEEYLAYLRSIGEMFANVGQPDPEHGVYRKIPYHGYVEFYALEDGEWFEFSAKFTDGKLVEIKLTDRHMLTSPDPQTP